MSGRYRLLEFADQLPGDPHQSRPHAKKMGVELLAGVDEGLQFAGRELFEFGRGGVGHQQQIAEAESIEHHGLQRIAGLLFGDEQGADFGDGELADGDDKP